MPNSVQSALVNPLEPSSRAACLFGPNALMPAAVEIIDDSGRERGFRADHDKIDRVALAELDHRGMVGTSSATHSASRAMPALPGAHQSFVTSGEAAIFHASACSRPPEPSRRMCMR